MPEIFFLYYEELDWSTSMTRAGYELWYEPRCTVFHKESQSTGQLSKLRTYFLTRNRLLYARRNMKGIFARQKKAAAVIPAETIQELISGIYINQKSCWRFDWLRFIICIFCFSSCVICVKRLCKETFLSSGNILWNIISDDGPRVLHRKGRNDCD